MNQQFTVPEDKKKERLDKFLTPLLGLPRTKVQKMIEQGSVTVNGKVVTPHFFLKPGEIIAVGEAMAAEPRDEKTTELKLVKVLYEDDDLVVINKPAGIAVHPGEGLNEATLVDWLLKKYPQVSSVGDEPSIRPGIVHRLDKDVSGCLAIAKNQAAFEHLKKQFQDHTIQKEYTALVYGKVLEETKEIKFPLSRSESGKMIARPEGTEGGREATTIFDVLKKYPQYTLLKVRTLTGRTHQIRTHLKAYGHSIVGDSLYAIKGQKIKENLPQIFLHASKLGFQGVKGTELKFEAPLPPALDNFLKQLP